MDTIFPPTFFLSAANVLDGVDRGRGRSFPIQVCADVDVNVADDPMLERPRQNGNTTSGIQFTNFYYNTCTKKLYRFYRPVYLFGTVELI